MTRVVARHNQRGTIREQQGAGPTSVELRPVVVRGVAQSAEEGGQVAADRYREHQGHADPERTCHTQTHTQDAVTGCFCHARAAFMRLL